jgi:hypothetical protein
MSRFIATIIQRYMFNASGMSFRHSRLGFLLNTVQHMCGASKCLKELSLSCYCNYDSEL